MSNADVDRYLAARAAMARKRIPPHILRRYLDALRRARANATGPMYAKRLVITGDWLRPGKAARALFESAIEEGYVIDTQGQKWEHI